MAKDYIKYLIISFRYNERKSVDFSTTNHDLFK